MVLIEDAVLIEEIRYILNQCNKLSAHCLSSACMHGLFNQDFATIVSCEAKKKQAICDERVCCLHIVLL